MGWLRKRKRRREERRLIRKLLLDGRPDQDRRVPCYVGDKTVLAPTHFDCWMYLDTDDLSVCPQILMTGTWEAGTTRFLHTYLHEGMHYVEVGANYGYYTLQAAMLVGDAGTVTAFEPAPRPFSLLARTIAVNGVGPRTTLHQAAVSSRTGVATLFLKGDWHGGSSLVPTGPEAPFEQRELEVPMTTLDATFVDTPDAMHQDRRVDFLKMDAEGAEADVMAGATKLLDANPHLILVIEASPGALRKAGADPVALMESLADRGYRFWMITEDGRAIRATAGAAMADRTQVLDVLCARTIPRPRPGFDALVIP
jgi:FkbM family methyltransferase